MREIIFNEEQEAAITDMLDFLNGSGNFYLLQGYAGTGKTTCISEVIRRYGKATALTAPTNKATRVLIETSRRAGIVVDCMTIYSLMGLKLRGVGEKQQIFPEGDSKMIQYNLIVIDEASMVNEDLFNLICEQAMSLNRKIIFMGDPAQLPPINEKESKVFELIERKSVLMKVMRHDNQILTLATRIRKAWDGTGEPDGLFCTDNDENGGVWCMDSKKFLGKVKTAFTSETYKDDPSKVRIIAWTNEAVREYNSYVRELLYGEEAHKPFHIDERVIACRPVIDAAVKKEAKMTEIVMTTDEEGVVISIKQEPHPIYTSFNCNALEVECDDGSVATCYVILPEEEERLNKTLDNMAKDAKSGRGSWKSFWEMKELFSDIRPCHALTAHRSQGSTYDTALVDVGNIMLNRRHKEMLQCLYVAVSRASRIVCARTR